MCMFPFVFLAFRCHSQVQSSRALALGSIFLKLILFLNSPRASAFINALALGEFRNEINFKQVLAPTSVWVEQPLQVAKEC